MSFEIHVVGVVVIVAALIGVAARLHIPLGWIALGAALTVGLAVSTGARRGWWRKRSRIRSSTEL